MTQRSPSDVFEISLGVSDFPFWGEDTFSLISSLNLCETPVCLCALCDEQPLFGSHSSDGRVFLCLTVRPRGLANFPLVNLGKGTQP